MRKLSRTLFLLTICFTFTQAGECLECDDLTYCTGAAVRFIKGETDPFRSGGCDDFCFKYACPNSATIDTIIHFSKDKSPEIQELAFSIFSKLNEPHGGADTQLSQTFLKIFPEVTPRYKHKIVDIVIKNLIVYAKPKMTLTKMMRSSTEFRNFVKDEYMQLHTFLSKKWERKETCFLKLLNLEELRFYRNAIFALKGKTFKDQKLQSAFEMQKWYKPNKSFNLEAMNKSDIKKVNIVAREEKARKEL